MQPPTTEPALPTEGQHSMLADVDDELLRQFANEFETYVRRPLTRLVKPLSAAAVLPGELSELAEGLDVSAEESDREIIEIFLAYGLEIMDKLRPLVSSMMHGEPDENDLESCADFINSIRSSATYMDYQKLASFLDDWYENTRSVMERESIGAKDLVFMQENFDRFQDFLRDLQRALNPQAAPVERLAAKAVATVERKNAPVNSMPSTVQEPNPSSQRSSFCALAARTATGGSGTYRADRGAAVDCGPPLRPRRLRERQPRLLPRRFRQSPLHVRMLRRSRKRPCTRMRTRHGSRRKAR